jgi:predicted amidohydrolase YtcJ
MDEKKPRATALAIHHGRIVAVGSDADVRSFAGSRSRIIYLKGRAVTPGLVDSHAHLLGLGATLEEIALRGAKSASVVASLTAAGAAKEPGASWILGSGWDQNLWSPPDFPSRRELDAVIRDRPVVLRRVDGHAVWVNSRALDVAGISAKTPDPTGGRIVRDGRGAPTGVLVDRAMDLVERKIPEPSTEVARRRILKAAHVALEAGITAVHEMGISETTAEIYRNLADEGTLPIRVYGFLRATPAILQGLGSRLVEIDRDGTQFFLLRGIKLFADGALGSRGAALLAPYSDDPKNSGIWINQAESLARAAEQTAAAGWQLAVHAIGDAANRAVLDAFEHALVRYPDRDLRFRVEHAQVLTAGDIPRFGKLGVIASVQFTHCTSDMSWAEQRLGPERIRYAYAWRSLLSAGAHLAGGSDFPVEEVGPLRGVYAAITRQDRDGRPPGGWQPEQRLMLEEALRAFTSAGAYAAFVERSRGALRPGWVADITVYDRPLVADSSLLATQVDMTVVGGDVAYERK